MKSRQVDYVTSNEEHVRLKIFDGLLPVDEGTAELLKIERAQNAALRVEICDGGRRKLDERMTTEDKRKAYISDASKANAKLTVDEWIEKLEARQLSAHETIDALLAIMREIKALNGR